MNVDAEGDETTRRRLTSFSTSIILGEVDRVTSELSHISPDASVLQQGLVLAAANGHGEVLRRLRDFGVDIHFNDDEALRVAVAGGRLEIVRYLHRYGASLKRLQSVLVRAAARTGHLEVLKYLHRNGCDLSGCRDLWEDLVCSPRLADTLSFLSRKGVFETGERDGAVARSILSGNVDDVRRTIPNTDVRALAKPFLTLAAKRGALEVLDLLSSSGADLASCGAAPLLAAAGAGHAKCVRWIAEHAPLDAENVQAALAVAAEGGHLEVVKYLYYHFGQSITGVSFQTLQLSALDGHVEVFDFLTDAGKDGIEAERFEIDEMQREMRGAAPIYHPSKFWTFFNEINLEQLRRFGVSRFKRCVNQNYFNYVPFGIGDEQFRGLGRHIIRHPTLAFLKARMRNPDRYVESGSLMTIDRRIFKLWSEVHGGADLGSFFQRLTYRALVALLWRCAEYYDVLGLRRGLAEPCLGAPIETWYRGRLISQDLAHSLIECNAILNGVKFPPEERPLCVAEIGAGYGRVGDILLSSRPIRYVVFDIPPSLYLAQWYLQRRHPAKKMFLFRHFDRFENIREEFEASDVAFCTINQIEHVPEGYFDLAINISSLHEMEHEQLAKIFGEMYRISRQRVYLKQYRRYRNPLDDLVVDESSYFIADGWRSVIWRRDVIDGRYFEAVLERTSSSVGVGEVPRKSCRAVATGRPSISIVLANFNDVSFLRTSLVAIVGQSDPADEILLIDDGSTDESVEVMRGVQAEFPSVQIIRHERNRGQHVSIQRGLLACKSDYIVWAASDDLLLPNFIERNRTVLAQNPGIGLSFSRLATFQDGGCEVVEFTEANHGVAFDLGREPKRYSPEDLAALLRFHYLWMSGNTVVARRSSLIEMGGFSARLEWHADWFSYYAVALRYGAVSIPETLAMMRVRPVTYSLTGMQDAAAQKRVLQMILKEIKEPRNLDLRAVFRCCPSLLSPFGRAMVKTGITDVRHWDVVMPLLAWYAKRGAVDLKRWMRTEVPG